LNTTLRSCSPACVMVGAKGCRRGFQAVLTLKPRGLQAGAGSAGRIEGRGGNCSREGQQGGAAGYRAGSSARHLSMTMYGSGSAPRPLMRTIRLQYRARLATWS
jgi:hypothetical protein